MTDRGVNKRLFRQIDEQANEQSINKQRIFKRKKQVTWPFSFQKLRDCDYF